MRPHRTRDEHGQVVVVFALFLGVALALGGAVIGIGNWFVHAKHLQTKADAAAFAGGGKWSFPCIETTSGGPTTSQQIVDTARQFAGPHMQADGTAYTGTTLNPQVGRVPGSAIHAVINGTQWYDDDANTFPQELTDPANPSVCDSKTLDVKLTEDNSFPLFSLLPVFPDIKRKARVHIEKIKGINGLLPIAVRVPKPLSAAAVFYDETPGLSYGTIRAVRYFCEDTDGSVGAPTGLAGWSTLDTADPNNSQCASNSWANVPVSAATGVVVATSFRPRCGVGPAPCMSDSGWVGQQIDNFCRQANGAVQCFYATGSGNSQTAQSGLQFIRGYSTGNAGVGPPELRKAWLDSPSPARCYEYFSATAAPCSALLHADFDFGSALNQTLHPGAAADVKYGVVYGTTSEEGIGDCATGGNSLDAQGRANCDMSVSGSSASATATFDPQIDNQGDVHGIRHAIVMRVRLTRTTIGPPGPGQITCPNSPSAICQWFFTSQTGQTAQVNATDPDFIFSHPVQRSITGDDNLTAPIEWLRLTTDSDCDGFADTPYGEAATQTLGNHCFFMDMGLRGAIATDQDISPFGFTFKSNQGGTVDCDPNLSNWKEEVQATCDPFYVGNDFTRTPTTVPSGPCPYPEGSPTNWAAMQSPPPPYDVEWEPFTCLLTGGPPNAGQVEQGLNGRFFNDETNPPCPMETTADEFHAGRNYWDDANNPVSGGNFAFADQGVHPNNLRDDDPRLVTLFLTTYASFGTTGASTIWAIVGFADFYITGYGKGTGGGLVIDDPCPGSTPPADMVIQPGAQYIWGHFVSDVTPPANATPSGEECDPEGSFTPCVPVLVE